MPRLFMLLLLPAALLVACSSSQGTNSLPDATASAMARGAAAVLTNTPSPPRSPSPTSTPVPASCLMAHPDATPIATSGSAPTATAQAGGSETPDPSLTTTPVPGERLAPPRDVPPPQPLRPAQLQEDGELRDELVAILGDEADGYAFVVKDVATGRGATFNADKVFYAASVFKLLVMYEVFHQRAEGLLRLEDELVMTPYYASFGLGPGATELCQRLNVEYALEAMMAVSDNAAAVLLQDLVGAGNVNLALAALGIEDTQITEELPLTAADAASLLEAIADGTAVDAAASKTMIELLLSETFDNGLRSGVPDDVPVAHKTGNWDVAINDVGIVFARSGTYVIAVLSDGRDGGAHIEALSAAAYDFFSR